MWPGPVARRGLGWGRARPAAQLRPRACPLERLTQKTLCPSGRLVRSRPGSSASGWKQPDANSGCRWPGVGDAGAEERSPAQDQRGQRLRGLWGRVAVAEGGAEAASGSLAEGGAGRGSRCGEHTARPPKPALHRIKPSPQSVCGLGHGWGYPVASPSVLQAAPLRGAALHLPPQPGLWGPDPGRGGDLGPQLQPQGGHPAYGHGGAAGSDAGGRSPLGRQALHPVPGTKTRYRVKGGRQPQGRPLGT